LETSAKASRNVIEAFNLMAKEIKGRVVQTTKKPTPSKILISILINSDIFLITFYLTFE
jgi:hypothetical protein